MFHIPFAIIANITGNITVPEGSIRIVGGSGPHEGRVEIYFYGYWGGIGTSYWDFHDTDVVCHQLGYLGGLTVPDADIFGRSKGFVWLTDVRCSGTEKNLTQCTATRIHRHYNYQYRGAQVQCFSKYTNFVCW